MAELISTNLFNDANLVSYYQMEGNSNDGKDSNNGTDASVTYNTSNGKYGQGAGLVGTGLINLGTGTNMNPSALTYAAWIKPSSFSNAYNSIINRTTAADGSKFAAFFIKSTGKLACYVFANASVSYDGTGSNTLSTGVWYHVALTYSSSDGLRGYVNGVEDGNAAANGAIATITGSTHIGNDPYYANRNWDGAIDDAAIFSRVLTASEVNSLYLEGGGFFHISS